MRQEAERDGSATVYVNFYGIISLDDAVARLERSYRELRGPLARWLTGRLSSINVTATTPVGSLTLGGERGASASARLYALLDLPRGAFQQTGERVLVVFDEFQEVLSARLALDGAIRSVIEQHDDEAAYLFAGSHPGMMAQLFDDRERPFYGQARAVGLGPLAAEDLAAAVWCRPALRRLGVPLPAPGGIRNMLSLVCQIAHHFIQQLRAEASLTQADLAERMGTTQSAVARLEMAGANPQLSTLERAIEALGRRLELRAVQPEVDFTQIDRHLAMAPAQRLGNHERSARDIGQLLAGARRVDRVR